VESERGDIPFSLESVHFLVEYILFGLLRVGSMVMPVANMYLAIHLDLCAGLVCLQDVFQRLGISHQEWNRVVSSGQSRPMNTTSLASERLAHLDLIDNRDLW